jgi:hypothetical protein
LGMAESGKDMESVVKGDQPMGMKGYGGDLERMFGIGGHGTEAKGETVPPAPAIIPDSRRGQTRNRGPFSEAEESESTPAIDSPPGGS